MKSRTNLLIALFLCFSIIAYSADVVKEQQGYKTTRVNKQVYSDGTYEFFNEVNYDYGSSIPGQNETKNFIRSIWEYSLPINLPTGYYVKKVELKFNCNSLKSFIMKYISDYPSNPSYSQKWDLIENGTFIAQFVGSNGTTYTQEIPEPVIRDLIQQAHDQSKSKVYISFQSATELMNTDLVTFSTLALKITYGIKVQLTVETNFGTGSVIVNGETKNYGDIVKLPENSSNSFGAIEPQTDPNNYERVWNDTEGANNKSQWLLIRPSRQEFNKGVAASISYTAISDDQNSEMIANLRKNYKISRNDQTEFDGVVPAGIVTSIIEQNSKNVPHPSIPAGGKTYNFGYWIGTSGDNYAPTGNATLTAFYKYANHSNNSNTFANNSQRKVANNEWKVYESSGSVWLESNNQVVNGGKPVNDLSSGPEAKSSSLDYNLTDNAIVAGIYVTYQQKTSDGKYKIKLAKFNESGQRIFNLDVFTSTKDYATFDATPVIAVTHTNSLANNKPKFIILWRQKAEGSYQDGLYYYGGIDNGTTVTWYYQPPQKLTSTDAQSSNPTIAVYKNPVGVILNHVAWQQSNTKIYYRGIYDNWNGGTIGGLSLAGNLEEPSAGGGLTINTNPSITVVNSNASPSYSYDSPKLTWLSLFYSQDPFAIFRDKNNSQYGTTWNNLHMYYSGGNAFKSININRTDLDNLFAFVYSDGSNNKYVKSTNLSSILSLSTHVNDLQISNTSEGWDGMNIIAYNKSSLPYTFTNAATVIFKVGQTPEARGGTVSRGNAEFYFGFGDVSLDGAVIDFKEKNDSLRTETSTELNNYFETKPFTVKDNSVLTYSISYGVKDSSLAVNELKENESINFKIELVDISNGKVLNTLNEVTQVKKDLKSQSNIYYKVNLSGLVSGEVKLRLVEEDNLNGDYVFSKIHLSNNGLMKTNYNEITLDDQILVKDYALLQNYPNPFNPSTIINYQIPKDGFVTLEIYDMLGKEVATLVNENKTTGRYNVEFNAGNLASGVYLYQLKVNDFVSTKKLVLLK